MPSCLGTIVNRAHCFVYNMKLLCLALALPRSIKNNFPNQLSNAATLPNEHFFLNHHHNTLSLNICKLVTFST